MSYLQSTIWPNIKLDSLLAFADLWKEKYLEQIADTVVRMFGVLALTMYMRLHRRLRIKRFFPHLETVETMEHGICPMLPTVWCLCY